MEVLQQAWDIMLGVVLWLWDTFSPLLIAIGRLIYDFFAARIVEWVASIG